MILPPDLIKELIEHLRELGYDLTPEYITDPKTGKATAVLNGFEGKWGDVDVWLEPEIQVANCFTLDVFADERCAAEIKMLPHYHGWRMLYHNGWGYWFKGDSAKAHVDNCLMVQWGIV